MVECHMDTIRSTEYDGSMRRLQKKRCAVCDSSFWVPRHRQEQRTCSRQCNGILRRDRTTFKCATCGKTFELSRHKASVAKSGVHFCSRPCKDVGQRLEGVKAVHPAHYGSGRARREIYVRRRGRKCENCQGTEWLGHPMPLELHHVDGDTKNDSDNNLKLLCPNCHALTPNFRGRRKGK